MNGEKKSESTPCKVLILFILVAVFAITVHAGQIDIVGPVGSSSFGYQVEVLPNGNIVVADPSFHLSPTATYVGAVYLYDGKTLALISRLTGSTTGDQIGLHDAITVLTNGNFVVHSKYWNNPAGPIQYAGAVTWCSGTIGCNGTVSATNSLVGRTTGDFFDTNQGALKQVFALTNGNYVVSSPNWDNPSGPIVDVGAVTWGNGEGGTVGLITPQNSLIGGAANDQIGSPGYINRVGIYPLTNGNYVVTSPNWKNPTLANVGAVTWGDGSRGTVGVVTASNSLVGSSSGDRIGSNIYALINGNFVVSSPDWDNPTGPKADVGAATWGSGTGGTVGTVSASNSLIGNTPGDSVSTEFVDGTGGVKVLTNGNYVVAATYWDAPGAPDAGAATWGNGAGGTVGVVSAANSLVGSSITNRVGSGFIAALTNGNYVVASPLWGGGLGAVTWGNGSSGTVGVVSGLNSLVGGRSSDNVGDGAITALSNGNYVVGSRNWDNPSGPILDVGAATWGNGNGGTVGLVTTSNSLIGSTTGDRVGSLVLALTNGNYVVGSSEWDNPSGPVPNVGAATLGNGAGGTVGLVTSANSLIGGTTNDSVGLSALALTNGNYVVISPDWDQPLGSIENAGAATWGNGTIGTVGLVTSSNSLVGGTRGDGVGWGSLMALPNGNYVVRSMFWDGPASPNTGFNAGAVTYASGRGSMTGTLIPANNVFGTVANGIDRFVYDRRYNRVVVTRSRSNIVSVLIPPKAPADFDGDGKTDLSIFRSSNGQWWYQRSSDGVVPAFTFGVGTDVLTPGDFTGDGKTDVAFFRPSNGHWYVLRSEDSAFYAFPFGAAGDVPVPADYDGDGKTDAAVFRPSTTTWFIFRSSDSGYTITNFGAGTDKPVVADYDGDGKGDIGIFRPADGTWWHVRSSDSQLRVYGFGTGSDRPTPGDFTGDGKADVAFWRPSNGHWYVLRSEDTNFYAFPFGSTGDVPTPGDYDGDGRIDAAVFRPTTATWFVNRSTQGTFIQNFGLTTDTPVPSAYVP